MAIGGGVLLALAETLINWGQWQWWPWWLVDFVAAALLIGGGLTTLARGQSGIALLCAGWGFALGMVWMSLAGNIEIGTEPERAARVAGQYIPLLVFGLSYAASGLALSLLRSTPN